MLIGSISSHVFINILESESDSVNTQENSKD